MDFVPEEKNDIHKVVWTGYHPQIFLNELYEKIVQLIIFFFSWFAFESILGTTQMSMLVEAASMSIMNIVIPPIGIFPYF